MRAWTKMLWKSIGVAAFLLAPGVTNAQTMDPETKAQSLLDDAVALVAKKQFAKACPLLEEATRLVPKGIGAKLELAGCYFGAGRLASAWRQYVHAEVLAIKARDERANEARIAANRLKPQLATITITVPNSIRSIEGLSIWRDGLEQGPGSWGMPIPVDTGTHTIEVTAPGRRGWKHEVNIEANGQHDEETVQMLEVDSNVIERILWEPYFPQWRKGLIVAGMGVTLLGIGLGTGFTIAARAQNEKAFATMNAITYRRSVNEMVCPVGRLDPACDELRGLLHTRNTYTNIAKGSFVAGGVVAAVMLTSRLVSRKNADEKNNHETLLVVPSLSGFSVMGTF